MTGGATGHIIRLWGYRCPGITGGLCLWDLTATGADRVARGGQEDRAVSAEAAAEEVSAASVDLEAADTPAAVTAEAASAEAAEAAGRCKCAIFFDGAFFMSNEKLPWKQGS